MADVVFRLDSESGKAVQGFLKLLDAQKRLEKGTKTLNRASKSQGDQTVAALKSQVAGFASLAGGIMGAVSAMKQMIAAQLAWRRAQAGKATERLGSRQQLLQISPDTKTFRRLTSAADQVANQTGMSGAAADDFMFALESSGKFGKLPLYRSMVDLTRNREQDPIDLVKSVKTFQLASGGARRTGTDRQVINQLLAAAGPTKTGFTEIGAASLRSAGQAARLGASPAENLGAMSMMTSVTKEPEIAGTYLRALLTALVKKGVKDTSIAGAVEGLRSKNLSGTKLNAYLGNGRAVAGYDVLAGNLDEMQSRTAAIQLAKEQTGSGADILSGRLAVGAGDPILSASRRQQASKRTGSTVGATEALTFEAAYNEYRHKMREQAKNVSRLAAGTALTGLGGFLGAFQGDPGFRAAVTGAVMDLSVVRSAAEIFAEIFYQKNAIAPPPTTNPNAQLEGGP